MKHTTGWYVWVGGKKHWFRDEDRAIDFAVLRQSQYGSAVVRRERADDRQMNQRKPRHGAVVAIHQRSGSGRLPLQSAFQARSHVS